MNSLKDLARFVERLRLSNKSLQNIALSKDSFEWSGQIAGILFQFFFSGGNLDVWVSNCQQTNQITVQSSFCNTKSIGSCFISLLRSYILRACFQKIHDDFKTDKVCKIEAV